MAVNESAPTATSEPDGSTRADDDRYVEFYRAEYAHAVRLVWLLTHRSPECEDIVQDGFMRVRSNFDRLTTPKAYLRTTLVNLCRERARRQGRDDARARLVAATSTTPSSDDLRLLDLVAGLPYRQKSALVLRYWADLTDGEIADVLGVRQATVRSIIHRATGALRKELSRDD